MRNLPRQNRQKSTFSRIRSATVKGGTIGGIMGTVAGGVGLWGAMRRFPAVRNLTIPFKAFLVSSVGTFSGASPASPLGVSAAPFNTDMFF